MVGSLGNDGRLTVGLVGPDGTETTVRVALCDGRIVIEAWMDGAGWPYSTVPVTPDMAERLVTLLRLARRRAG